MSELMIRYRVKRDQVQRNLELLRAAYEELESTRPEDLRWVSYQLEDEVTFVSLVGGGADPGALAQLPAFRRFRSTLDERCDELSVMTELREVGSFRSR
ncbi:MAG: hypothetical protein M3R63_00990 [Actinomycetota bacterium]|nr:hypothetical protein [Actinomycetota bacterium]